MANLSKQKDRKRSREAVNSGSADLVKLTEGHNFVILLEPEYEEGYTHWFSAAGKSIRRTCLSDPESQKGWDPEGCAGCAYAKELFEKANEYKEEGDKQLEEKTRKKGNDVKAKYSAVFKAARVGSVIERDPKTKKKSRVPNYEEVEIGKLSLTYAQLMKVCELLDSEEDTSGVTEESISDWVLDFYKEKLPNERYAKVTKVVPVCEVSEEELEIDEEDVPDISTEFEITDDMEEVVAEIIEAEEDEEYKSEPMKKKGRSKRKEEKQTKSKSKKQRHIKSKKKDEDDDEDDLEDDDDFEDDEDEDDDIPF